MQTLVFYEPKIVTEIYPQIFGIYLNLDDPEYSPVFKICFGIYKIQFKKGKFLASAQLTSVLQNIHWE